MKTYLVTGGVGFIGSNFVLHMLAQYDMVRIVNVDKLTYAGNLENLASISNDSRHLFRQVDICDKVAIDPEKIKHNFGWYPETAFEEGIVKTIQWYLNNAQWIENVTSGMYLSYYKKMYESRLRGGR